MPNTRPICFALFVIAGVILALALAFSWPFLSYDIRTHQCERRIKRQQSPEALREWAKNLIATYSASNYDGIEVTNGPPTGIPISGRNPRILLQHDRLSETNYGPYHITLAWAAGAFLPMWGMDIGETNFVTSHKNPEMWVPGIYFFVEPP